MYDCSTWAPVAQFGVATHDLADLAWSPDGSCLAVWDSPAHSFTVAIYSPEGECLATHQPYSHALGVKCLAWSPSGQLLAVGSFDQVRGPSVHDCVRAALPVQCTPTPEALPRYGPASCWR